MRRIYVTTIGREHGAGQVHCIDYDTGKVINQTFIPPTVMNLKGSKEVFGARGIDWKSGELWVAGYDSLFTFDEDLNIEKGFWIGPHDLHGIYFMNDWDGLWLTSTRQNKLLFWDDELQTITSEVSLDRLDEGKVIDPSIPSDTLHINSMCELSDGTHAVLCNRIGKVFEIKSLKCAWKAEWATGPCLIDDSEHLINSHDLVELSDGKLLINDSMQGKTIAYYKYRREPIFTYPHEIIKTDFSQSGWFRGLKYVEQEDLTLIGSSPARIYCLKNGDAKEIVISEDINESVYGIEINPNDWSIGIDK